VNSVAAYRLCHTEEIERAVGASKGTRQHWKFGVGAKAICR
jgi:hypothetical protein